MQANVIEPIYSVYAFDPDMRDIVEMFVEDVPSKISKFLKFEEEKNWGELRRAAHQLKGSAGGYGFDVITDISHDLEDSLRSGEPSTRTFEVLQNLIAHLSAIQNR